jgi:hypothetical protein
MRIPNFRTATIASNLQIEFGKVECLHFAPISAQAERGQLRVRQYRILWVAQSIASVDGRHHDRYYRAIGYSY